MDAPKPPFHVVGLYSPAAGSGKSTAAKYLRDSLGLMPVAFAEPIKAMVLRFLYLFYPGEGGQADQYQWAVQYFLNKERPIEEIPGKPRLRDLLEGVGEGLRERGHPDVWVEIARAGVERLREGFYTGNEQPRLTGVVFDDVRRENEARLVKSLGGVLVQIRRPGVTVVPNVKTEGQLDGLKFDATLLNIGTKGDFFKLVTTSVAELLQAPRPAVHRAE